MDELKTLRELRADLPGPTAETRERAWNQILQEIDRQGDQHAARPAGLARTLKKLLVGLVLLVALALSPMGPAIADRLDGLFALDDSGPVPTQRDRAAIGAMNRKLEEAFKGPRPSGTPQERREMSSALITAIAEEASFAAGGKAGSVTIKTRYPLEGLGPAESAALCAKIDRYLARKQFPPDRYCDLKAKIQAGQIPPGTYTRSQIDELIGPGG